MACDEGVQNFLLGAQGKVNTTLLGGDKTKSAVALGDCSDLVGYTTDDFTVFAQVNKWGESVDLGLTHVASSSLTAGFLASVSLKDSKAPVCAP